MSTNGAVCASAATATRFARDRGEAAAASTEDARRDDLGVVGVDDARSVHSRVYPSRMWSPLAKHATVSGNRMTAPGATFFAARRTGPTHTNGFPGGSGIDRSATILVHRRQRLAGVPGVFVVFERPSASFDVGGGGGRGVGGEDDVEVLVRFVSNVQCHGRVRHVARSEFVES